MRAGVSTIQQTLTPEAANVLSRSITDAARRGHGQTTPLHVAAVLLSSPTGLLRQACIRSHPNSSHPLQCRALDLCFSVALDRLPTGQQLEPGVEPPISNALMAALKRAQAHQRRGCPEQQQPLLAIKVELEQLVVSILDDPGVSRVMREASFSSPAVKAAIEQSQNSVAAAPPNSPLIGRNLYVNPRLQPGKGADLKRVVDVLLRLKKRNPVLVGEFRPEAVVRELLQLIEKREIGDCLLQSIQVISLEKEFGPDRLKILAKLSELGNLIEARIGGNGLIINLGDLKWLVGPPAGMAALGSSPIPQQPIASEAGRVAVAEIAKLLLRFGSNLRLIGTATCETYLRCQVYHPSMENDWDLQAVPITAKAPQPGLFSRHESNGILNSSITSFAPLKCIPAAGPILPSCALSKNKVETQGATCCPACLENYERDLAKIVPSELEKDTSHSKPELWPILPQWMQNAKPTSGRVEPSDQSSADDQGLTRKKKTKELQKRWNDICRLLHPSFHTTVSSDQTVTTAHSMTSSNPNLFSRQPFQPKLDLIRSPVALQMEHVPVQSTSDHSLTPLESPVLTDLVLGQPNITEIPMEKTHEEQTKHFTGHIPSRRQQSGDDANALDADSFKRIFNGLMAKVGWQLEAAAVVASTVVQCQAGNGKRRGVGVRGDTWLLFVGLDKVGKKKMAVALSELLYGAYPITIHVSSRADDDEKSEMSFRGKTVLDRIVGAVRRNPFSVVMLEDIDQADMLLQANIKRAIGKGRLADSHGREISLGNVIFIMTSKWVPENLKNSLDAQAIDEERLAAMAGCGWELQISVTQKPGKRLAEWLLDNERPLKPKKGIAAGTTLSFDLNLAADAVDDDVGSHNSSDLTTEHDQEHGLMDRWPSSQPPLPSSLINTVDGTIIFKPVNFSPLRSKVTATITEKFTSILGHGWTIQLDSMVVERLVGGAWFGKTGFEEWVDRVLVPGFQQLKDGPFLENPAIVRLLSVKVDCSSNRYWLPSKIAVVVDGGV